MGKKLYIGNLSYDTTESGLRELFAEAGTVESVSVITDRDTGRARGFAFVEMSSEEEAKKAIALINGKSLGGRMITVAEARPQERRESGGYGPQRNSHSNRGGSRRY